ncbi:hypothetical protein SPRG_02000 [Saprolegnia parasitica CBS 223.65]|uniref:Uncharacterized protein n=1 Tax=Saprolegnia parasitica (strain CBS 223.65) TaxID=695850 RepID=A0A067CRU2_SAPPC|nr:hypothetical protein SPRG_02000 [Saprolegnia parasitica CBS 223.65]KDO33188.1 hypothetical protein SPRG_02000 [Saprolegnia parasitica CBS 223.65]|eukprot:XP_012195949.1 hypothetical protein SPRG_02000 [Saprolegnia parasitica CBS 223.65]
MARSVLTNDDLWRVTTIFSRGKAAAQWRDGNLAAALGHVYLLEHLPALLLTPAAMEAAAANGHLAVVQWIHSNRPETRSPCAMLCAAENNHLHIVSWLHAHAYPDALAMDAAAAAGHLEVVQWLHAVVRSPRSCSVRAMDQAAEKGHLDVLQWLHLYRREGCTTDAMDYAACAGHLGIVQWLAAHRREGCTKKALLYAAFNGHLAVVQFLCGLPAFQTTDDIQRAMHLSGKNGQRHVADWLRTTLSITRM